MTILAVIGLPKFLQCIHYHGGISLPFWESLSIKELITL